MTLELRPFQVKGVEWLRSRRAALLGDEMGVGKTCQAIMAVLPGVPALVACPASMKGIWKQEIERWRPDFAVVVLSGKGSFRWPKPGEFVIVNYDILPEELGKDTPRGLTVIADEATAVKSNKSQRHKRFEKICTQALRNKGSVWLLTATPILNSPYELWNILKTADLTQEAFGHFGKFLYMFGGTQGRFGITYGVPRPEARTCLNKVMLRRTQNEVTKEVPPMSIRDYPVEIPDNVRRICDRAMEILQSHGINMEAVIEAVDLTRLTGAEFEEVSRARKELAMAKIPAMLEFIESYEEASEPLVIFSAHRAPIDLLAKRDGWGSISGGDNSEDRARTVQRFQDGQLKGVAATLQAGGMGITLTRACHAALIDRSWTPDINRQAMYRLKRMGQTRNVLISIFKANHAIDDRVGIVNEIKSDLIMNTVDQGAATVSPDAFEES